LRRKHALLVEFVQVVAERGRPVPLARAVATADAVDASDVHQRDEDMAVEFDLLDVTDDAERREAPLLRRLASVQPEFDVFADVLARVVLHAADPSAPRG